MSDEVDWPQEPAERVRELVEGVLDELDLDGEVEIEEDNERILATGRVEGGRRVLGHSVTRGATITQRWGSSPSL